MSVRPLNANIRFAVGILLIILINHTAAATKIYKWTDDEGNVVYSQTPPPRGVESEKVRETPPPPVDPNEAMQTLRERAEAFNERREERLEVETKGEEAAAQAKQQREICEQLRTNLTNLQSGKQVRVQSESGEPQVIGEEQRLEKVKATQERLQKECSGL